jgi:hypothetical protein
MEDELEDDDAPPIKQQKVKDDRKLVRRYSPPFLFDEPDVANIQEEQER